MKISKVFLKGYQWKYFAFEHKKSATKKKSRHAPAITKNSCTLRIVIIKFAKIFWNTVNWNLKQFWSLFSSIF